MKAKIMNNKYLITSAILLSTSALAPSSANAQALDGFYISGKIGFSSLNHTIERNIGDATLPVQDTSGVTTANNTNKSLGGAIGYTLDLNDRFFVGAEGFSNFEEANPKQSGGSNTATVNQLTNGNNSVVTQMNFVNVTMVTQ